MNFTLKNILLEGQKVKDQGQDLIKIKGSIPYDYRSDQISTFLQNHKKRIHTFTRRIYQKISTKDDQESYKLIINERFNVNQIRSISYDYRDKIIFYDPKIKIIDLTGYDLELHLENNNNMNFSNSWIDLFLKREYKDMIIEYHIVLRPCFNQEYEDQGDDH